MKRSLRKGGAVLEFTFSLPILVPLLLGTGAVGINMVKTHETIVLARDAGRMYARQVAFTQPGNKTILATVGADLGLSATADTGNAVVILSKLLYVDATVCASVSPPAVDVHGNPSGCTNYQEWVFTERITVGNKNVRTSNLGQPLTTSTNDSLNVVVNSDGSIDKEQYVRKAGAKATFTGVNPYAKDNDAMIADLPSGQVLYVAECAAKGFNMPPFITNAVTYSWGIF